MRKLKEIDVWPEIIVISGQPAPTELPARVRSWLTKPLTVDELVTEITRA